VTRDKRRKRPRLKRSRGALLTLAVILLTSGAIRFGTGMGEALTREQSTPEAPVETATQPPEVAPLLAALQEREERLRMREDAIAERMQALAVSEATVEAKVAELIEAEARLAETLALADQASERDLTRLTSVYESMKPADAAALFEEMDPTFAAGFLSRMRPESAAPVLAGLTPRSAYTISVILAGRHVSVPTE